ncbi:glycosyltransferase family 2 protein [Streptomyces fractus]|uniref:glycosyltransferase family 2 protein n=1 Tax=Streptomyces fractus TaxID=641806 RepID=UPI003CEF05FB
MGDTTVFDLCVSLNVWPSEGVAASREGLSVSGNATARLAQILTGRGPYDAARVPDVSVILPVYNAGKYLVPCLVSVLGQSIGPDAMEVIAVDDASTDGSTQILGTFAASYPNLRVVHRTENSGTPSVPRNEAMDLARGRWLYMMDADDLLDPVALEELVKAGDDNDTDVVMAKQVGVGRGAATSPYGKTMPRTDVYHSKAYNSMRAQHLYRRSLVEEHGLRFPSELRTGEDGLFHSPALICASAISIMCDRTYLYVLRRDDAGNITSRVGPQIGRLTEIMLEDIAARVPAGPQRDFLHARRFNSAVFELGWRAAVKTKDPELREELLTKASELLHRWYTPGIARRVNLERRVFFELLIRGHTDLAIEQAKIGFQVGTRQAEPPSEVHDNGTVYLPYIGFRDPTLGIPDEVYARA